MIYSNDEKFLKPRSNKKEKLTVVVKRVQVETFINKIENKYSLENDTEIITPELLQTLFHLLEF